jgi:hypothetical protein
LVLTSDQLKSYALLDIEALLQCHGKSLDNYNEMPKTDRGLVSEVQNRLIYAAQVKSLVEMKMCLILSLVNDGPHFKKWKWIGFVLVFCFEFAV